MSDLGSFAASRSGRLADFDKELRPLVAKSLKDRGWADIVTGASVLWLELYEQTAGKDAPYGLILKRFQNQLRATLKKTKSDESEVQIDMVTKWVGTFTANDATYYGGRASGHGTKEWVTAGDDSVRATHRAVNQTRVPLTGAFSVGGTDMRYPGEPVADLSLWINCRCLLLTHQDEDAMTAAADPQDDDTPTTAVIVALVADADPVARASSEEDGAHCTLAFLGEVDALESHNVSLDDLKANLAVWAQRLGAGKIPAKINGRGLLGPSDADVLFVESESLTQIREGMVNAFAEVPKGRLPEIGEDEQEPIARVYHEVDQYPTWVPHVTLGYPDTPANGQPPAYGADIIFDRLALWAGDDRTEYPMGQTQSPTAPLVASADDDDEFINQLIQFATEPIAEQEDELDDPGPIPFHGVMAPIGKASRDGRMFAREAVYAGPGATLRYQRTETHGGGNVAIGTITKMFEEDGLIKYQGFLASPDVRPEVNEVIQGLAEGWLSSTSVDLGEFRVEDIEGTEFAEANPDATLFTLAEIAALTVVGIGAFRESYFALGECDCPDEEEAVVASAYEAIAEAAEAEFAPGTKDGPGWITHPRDTARIRKYWVRGEGAAKIKWGVPGDFNRCRKQLGKYVHNPAWLAGLCANMHKEALGVWPGRESGGRHATLIASGDYAPAITASAAPELEVSTLPAAWFENPGFDRPTPLTVTPEGHVFGHIALWGTCHIGLPGVCTTPPHSKSNYSYFRVGMVETDGGEVAVGQITLGVGHASLSAKPRAAAAHYDNVNSATADIACGEDVFGIWFSGAVRGGLSPERIATLKAAKVSGDWRDMGRGLEMIAVLAVNVPGYPVPRTAFSAVGDHQTALVASGILEDDDLVLDQNTSLATQMGIVDAVVAEVEARMALKSDAAEARAALLPHLRSAEIAEARKALV